MYYVSRALREAEVRYPFIERIVLSLMITARKLHPYFQSHTIRVITDLTLNRVLQKPNASGRLIQWSLELSEFDISYFPHIAIKGQAVVDFLLDFVRDSTPVEGDDPHLHDRICTVHVGGSSNRIASKVGVALTSP